MNPGEGVSCALFVVIGFKIPSWVFIPEPVRWPQRRGQGCVVVPLLALTGAVNLALRGTSSEGEQWKMERWRRASSPTVRWAQRDDNLISRQ
jgi:hypothetical protein